MVFSSLIFLFRFLPAVLVLYFVPPFLIRVCRRRNAAGSMAATGSIGGGAAAVASDAADHAGGLDHKLLAYQNIVLFAVSLIFYAWGEPVYILLMLFSILVNYVCGLLISRAQNGGRNRTARTVLIISIVISLGLLGFFKYADFVVDNLNTLIFAIWPDADGLTSPEVSLPVGISFYTFQTMSYTIDVYRRQVKAQKNFITFGAYVAMFPQLIAGPIVQYKTVEEQLADRRVTADGFSYGTMRFICGLAKKVLLANMIGALWDGCLGTFEGSVDASFSVLTAWLGALAYTFQIYFDFSGYSDMAIGMGHMFGFTFLDNFDHPYISSSITEFWRRWHISLGTWFREYVYIPLGGNRKGLAKQLRNILIVWALTGIWHGASWNFLVWGLYFGVLLTIEKLGLLRVLNRAPRFVGRIYTFFLVVLSWVIFACDSLGEGLQYIGSMFGAGTYAGANDYALFQLREFLPVFVILFLGSTELPARLYRRTVKKAGPIPTLLILLALFVISVAFIVEDSYNPFLYFRF